ncbi:MAG: SDR family oxidoreductase [Cryomorphaceae bacterium]
MSEASICITGASKGLGLALVRAFAASTGKKVLAVTRNPGVLKHALGSDYPSKKIEIVDADICTEQGRATIYDAAESNGGIGILIHNAGRLLFKAFKEIESAELEDVYRVNVFAPFLLTQKLLPLFKGAHIISVSSIGGVEGSLKFGGLSAYSSSKAALNCLTEMWSEEFKETDHSFNCLALGSVETEMFKEAFPGVSAASTPEEMANYIVEFAKTAPSVMRGKIISLSKSNP